MYAAVWQKGLMSLTEFAELDYLQLCTFRAFMEYECENMQKGVV